MSRAEGKKQAQDKQLGKMLEEELGDKKKPETVHLGDTAALKRALDDAAIEALREEGYQINNVLTDSKIALGFLACAVACIAQFYPGNFPDTYWILMACITVYCLLSLALAAHYSFIEKDIIALTHARSGKRALVVRSSMPRFQGQYSIAVQLRGNAQGSGTEAKLVSSVGAFFDSDGVLVAQAFKPEVIKLVNKVLGGGSGSAVNGGSRKSD